MTALDQKRRLISTGSPFELAFGYSRAVVDGDLVFVSGTTGYDYVTMTIPEDAAEQARNIFRTLDAVLIEAGSALANVVRAQYFVTDRSYCEPVLAVCGEVFGQIRPAAGMYVVAGLLKPEMKIEIEITARISYPAR
ncbi:Endoribonuclease L-PSP [Bosea sp. LC85]|uniref:RidA family protein n=1 Tax=Bosea sp. LC85 TaxID=1502851 RepID=UPI0004E3ACBC|nr:RidA family protein [Bosea sp. LC85]KFC73953.1 Endoribonuclease L-PSP [Bosea sp. LC85]